MSLLEAAPPRFVLPERSLRSLPTGSVKAIVETMGRKIANSEFGAGDHLPKEPDLVEMFGVSRTVVREAIKVLSGKGMVRTARRYGTRVAPFEEWNLLDSDVIQWHGPDSPMASRIYSETTELRCMLEPEAAALAALKANERQRRTILASAEMIRPEPYGVEGMIAADYTFHATVLEATGNMMLRQMQGLILALLKFSYSSEPAVVPDPVVSRRNHVSVAVAIAERHADAARQRMASMLELNRNVARWMAGRGMQ